MFVIKDNNLKFDKNYFELSEKYILQSEKNNIKPSKDNMFNATIMNCEDDFIAVAYSNGVFPPKGFERKEIVIKVQDILNNNITIFKVK